MKRIREKLITKVIQIKPAQQEMLDAFTQKWGFISEAEVFRQGLLLFYRKTEPDYLQPSMKEKEKLAKLAEEKRVADMPDEQYAKEILKGVLGTNKDGERIVMTFAIANSFYTPKLTNIKQWAARDEGWFLNYNLEELAKGRDLRKELEKAWNYINSTLSVASIDPENKE